MAAIQGHPRYQNITMGAPWVGEVDLLQDGHSVPDMSVKDMYYGRCTHCQPPHTPLNGSAPWSSRAKKRHPICMWKSMGWGESPTATPLPRPCKKILCLPVERQKPHHQVFTTVRALNPQPLLGPVGESLPCHMPLVRSF